MKRMPSGDLSEYLELSDLVDFDHPTVTKLAKSVADISELYTVRNAFEIVRDSYPHTFDIGGQGIAVSASDVIRLGHGFCFAKSHLLAALLRYNGIPAGFCYQRIRRDNGSHILHGFNAARVCDRWIVFDARGNNDRVEVVFNLDSDMRAFQTDTQNGELDYEQIFSRPDRGVINALRSTGDPDRFIEVVPGKVADADD